MLRRTLGPLVVLFSSVSALSRAVEAQVVIAPPVLTLVEPERFGTFTVENRSTVPQEVTIEFRFGYPMSDGVGNLQMVYDDSGSPGRSSMASWVRAFPRRALLRPG